MKLDAFFGELPLNAFKPRNGKFGSMTLEGGGNPISAVTNAISSVASGVGNVVSDVASGVGNVASGAVNTVEDLGASIDKTVRDVIPGGWTTAALLAAGAYYSPEIGAWIGSDGAVVPGSAGVAPEVSAVASPVASGTVAATDLGTLGSVGSTGTGLTAGATGLGLTAPETTAALTGSTGTGLTAGGTGLGLTAPEATTGLGLTAPVASGLAAGTAAGTSAADLAGIGAGLGTSGAAAGTDSLLTDAALGAAGAGAGSALGSAAGSAAGSSLSSMLPYMAAGQIGAGLLQANASTEAAKLQADAAAKALAQQQTNFNTINAQQAPYRAAGYGALNQLANLGSGQTQQYDASGNVIGATTNPSDYLTHQFNAADLAAGLAPNYDFMLQQGQMANQRAANAGGGGLSGNALQGLQKYTQDYAGNAYQNAFSNYQTQRSNIYNTLAGIAGIGQTGQTAANTAGTNLANAASQLGVGSAGAQAAGLTGQTNAIANTAGNVINNYTLASLLNQGGRVA